MALSQELYWQSFRIYRNTNEHFMLVLSDWIDILHEAIIRFLITLFVRNIKKVHRHFFISELYTLKMFIGLVCEK